jgi:hypothetical protein
LQNLNDGFLERVFSPDDEFWGEKLRGLLDRFDAREDQGKE